jgi:hypothetical protein
MSLKPAGYYKFNTEEREQTFRNIFEDGGWETPRVLEGMDKANDFYIREIA